MVSVISLVCGLGCGILFSKLAELCVANILENSVNFETLIKADVITRSDLDFFIYADTVDEAFDYITGELEKWVKQAKLI